MIQEKLWRAMLICSLLFTAGAMGVMLWFSATKTIVIAEEAAPEQGSVLPSESEEDRLRFETGGGVKLAISLPEQLKADDIVIENRYMEHEIHIILTGQYGDFYRKNAISGNTEKIKEGFFGEEEGGTRLRLVMDGLYEHQYIFENGVLYLDFLPPKQLYDKILVVDAACGGREDGNIGNGIKEKTLTLKLSELVKEALADSEIRVYCTRTDDSRISLERRLEFADELGADLLVSIRAGADSGSAQVFGIQSFYNADYFIPYLGNVQLADLLERNVVEAAGGKANGLFEASKDDFLLQNAQIPSAAIAVGYLTNREEAAALEREDYQKKLAEGIAKAVGEAFAVREQEP